MAVQKWSTGWIWLMGYGLLTPVLSTVFPMITNFMSGFVSLRHLYVEALTSNVTAFGDWIFRR